MKTVLITGGAGFIGSHVVRRFVKKYSDYKIINLDKLTYAGNLENLRDIEKEKNYEFIKAESLKVQISKKRFAEFFKDSVIEKRIHFFESKNNDKLNQTSYFVIKRKYTQELGLQIKEEIGNNFTQENIL